MPITPTHGEHRKEPERMEEHQRETFREPPYMQPRRRSDDEPPPRKSSRALLWIAIILLAGGLAAAGWLGYARLDEHGELLNQMRAWKGSLDHIGVRVAEVETKLQKLPDDLAAVKASIAGVDDKLAATGQEARRGVQRMSVSLRREIHDANTANSRRLEARLQELNQARREDLARTAELERQVSRLNQQAAANAADAAALREIASHDRRQLGDQIEQTNSRVSEVASFNNRPREIFSLVRNSTRQIGPAVLLHITRADPLRRQFDGWMQLVDEGKFLWLKNQGVLQSYGFHAGPARLRHDLIVTDLTRDSVAGYLILPSEGEANIARR